MTTCPYCGTDKRNLPTHLEHTCYVKQIADKPDVVDRWRYKTKCCGGTPVEGSYGWRCSRCGCRVVWAELVDKKQ